MFLLNFPFAWCAIGAPACGAHWKTPVIVRHYPKRWCTSSTKFRAMQTGHDNGMMLYSYRRSLSVLQFFVKNLINFLRTSSKKYIAAKFGLENGIFSPYFKLVTLRLIGFCDCWKYTVAWIGSEIQYLTSPQYLTWPQFTCENRLRWQCHFIFDPF